MEAGNICQIGTPDEVYSNPKTQFIADFIGTMNFFDARLTHKEGKLAVDIAGTNRMFQPNDTKAVTEDDVVVAVRPESIILKPKGSTSSDTSFAGYVQIQQFLGKSIRYQVIADIGGKDVMVQVDQERYEAVVKEGDSVTIDFLPETMLVFQNGERIA